MKVALTERVLASLTDAPVPVQKAFIKQIALLGRNLRHPSLHAKKYDEGKDFWQARVYDDWRFYFTVKDDTYTVISLIPHPK